MVAGSFFFLVTLILLLVLVSAFVSYQDITFWFLIFWVLQFLVDTESGAVDHVRWKASSHEIHFSSLH